MMAISLTVTIVQLVLKRKFIRSETLLVEILMTDSDASDFGEFDDEFGEYEDDVTSDMSEMSCLLTLNFHIPLM